MTAIASLWNIPVTGSLLADDHVRPTEVKSNLERLQGLLKQSGEELFQKAQFKEGDSVMLHIDSLNDGWIWRDALSEVLHEHHCRVFLRWDSSATHGYLVQSRLVESHVIYDNIFRDGFLGKKYLTRSITPRMVYAVTQQTTHELLLNGTLTTSAIDTIAADDLPQVENTSIKSTQGILPSDTFLDRAMEPFLIIGATGIAIYLLFHIRS